MRLMSEVSDKKDLRMLYQITGKHIDVGEALQTHVKNELNSVVQKYAERPTDANVVFSKSAHEFVCEATVHLSTGLTATARPMPLKYIRLLMIAPRRWRNSSGGTSAV